MLLAYRSVHQPILSAGELICICGSLPKDWRKSGTTKVQPSAGSAAGAVRAESKKCDFLRKLKNPGKQPRTGIAQIPPSAPYLKFKRYRQKT
jgi:hypothetical protein